MVELGAWVASQAMHGMAIVTFLVEGVQVQLRFPLMGSLSDAEELARDHYAAGIAQWRLAYGDPEWKTGTVRVPSVFQQGGA